MALIQCSECKKEISDKATSCPHCGAPTVITAQPKPKNNAECTACNIPMIPIKKKKKATLAGTLAALLFIFGLIALIANWLLGLMIILLAFIVGTVNRSEITVMTCPNCGREGLTL